MANTIPQMFIEKAESQPDVNVQYSKNEKGAFIPTTYRELLHNICSFAAGLNAMGVKRGDNIGLISDNRKEWLTADLAILGL
ncbi:MAG: AMP-binding protein, partial [Spirochaetia bacterium]|nr:AMP-binding protein [Spirochaetia bacterium]